MIVRLAIRGYLRRVRQWERRVDLSGELIDTLPGELGETHRREMEAGNLDMIEIEFLDERDVTKRFCRIGTNSARMVLPADIDDIDLDDFIRKTY